MAGKKLERGQSITFRIPSDTPDYLLKQLQKIKETERRNFSSTIAGYVLKGVNESFSKEKETVTIPLPKRLTKEQKNWLKHEHSEALIGTILYHLLNDPMRATALLASLNSNSSDIDEVLYLQEEPEAETFADEEKSVEPVKEPEGEEEDDIDLDHVDLSSLDIHSDEEPEEEEEADPLADFFDAMNK
jgi:hypothetical protein